MAARDATAQLASDELRRHCWTLLVANAGLAAMQLALLAQAAGFGLGLGIWTGALAALLVGAAALLFFRASHVDVVHRLASAAAVLLALGPWAAGGGADPAWRGLLTGYFLYQLLVQAGVGLLGSGRPLAILFVCAAVLALFELTHPYRLSPAAAGLIVLFAGGLAALGQTVRRLQAQAREADAAAARTNKALSEAIGEVAAQRDAVTRFIASASHDLQQPVQASALYVDGALEADDPVARLEALGRARTALDAARTMLQSMLDLLRRQSGASSARVGVVPVDGVLTALALEHELAAERAGLAICTVRSRLVALADPELLHRIIGNLIANAIRHSGGTRILVGARARAGRVIVLVLDDGRGIPPGERGRIFDEFATSAREQGGFGMGLATARAMAGDMAGSLALDDRWSRGSCFALELPQAGRRIPAAAEPLCAAA